MFHAIEFQEAGVLITFVIQLRHFLYYICLNFGSTIVIP